MTDFSVVPDPVMGGTGEPTPLELVAIGNISRAAEERLNKGLLFTQKQPDAARLRYHIARLSEGVQPTDRAPR